MSVEREPRELRNLAPVEVAAIIALALAPLPDQLPVAAPLVIAATASRWLRRRTWSQLLHGDGRAAPIGAAAGIAALAIALGFGTPLVELLAGRAVEWTAFPIVRGSASQLVAVAMVVIAMAIATELALRGWIVERVLELSRGQAILAVLTGAIAEAVVTPGGVAARIGAGLFGIGLGWIHVASGRNLLAPMCARIAFALGAVILEALQIVG